MGYNGPSPPQGTGIHHYIFDIYDLGKITKRNPNIITRLIKIGEKNIRGGHNHIINALNDNNAGYKIASVSYTINSGRMD